MLFGENWNIPNVPLKTRSILTVVTMPAVEVPGEPASTVWFEEVRDEDYGKLK